MWSFATGGPVRAGGKKYEKNSSSRNDPVSFCSIATMHFFEALIFGPYYLPTIKTYVKTFTDFFGRLS